jgi:exosome complex component RRP46
MTSTNKQSQSNLLNRTFSSRASVLSRADGSAWWEARHESTGSQDPIITTQILAAVYGPRAPTKGREYMDHASLEITILPATKAESNDVLNFYPTSRSTYLLLLQHFLFNAFRQYILLSLHPRTQISVIVQILHDGGSLLSSIVNCMTIALFDAGTPMIGCLVGVTVGWRRTEQTSAQTSWNIVIEPTLQEIRQCDIISHYIIDQSKNVVSEWDFISSDSPSLQSIPETLYWEGRTLALRTALQLHSFIRVTTQKLIAYQQQLTS